MVVRLTPGAKPGQDGELLAPSPSPEPADRSAPSARNESSRPKEDARERARSLSTLPAWLRRLADYILALLFVAVAALVRGEMGEVLRPTPFLVFYLAWVAAAAFGGLGPGLLATLASWLCVDFFFDATPWHIAFLHDPEDAGRLMVLIAGGLAVSVVGERARRARIRQRRQTEELADAHAALQESEEKYRIVADNTYDWEFWLDPEDRFLYTSPSCERVTGYAAHEFMNRPGLLQEIIHPDDLPAFLQHEHETPPGHRGDIEFRLMAKDGQMRWIHHVCQAICAKEGGYAGSRGSNRDITARKRAEESLRASEEKYRFLVENSKDVTWMVDLQGRWTFVSSNVEKVTGYRADELIGKAIWDFLAPECRDLVRDKWRRRLRGEDLPSYEVMFVGKDGRPRPFEVVTASIVGEGGKIVGVQGVSRDITERKQAEAALRASEEKYRFLVENSKDVTWTIDLQGRWTFISSNVEKVAGYRVDEVIGKTLWDFLAPECHDLVRERLRRRARGEDLPPYEVLMVDKDGRRIPFELVATSIVDDDGNIVGVQGVSREITERKRAEQELNESRNRYQALIETTADFIWEMDAEGRYTYCSPQMKDLWGYEPEDMIGKSPFDVMPPEDREQALRAFMSLAQSPQPFTGLEAFSYDSQGRLISVEISGVPFFDADGRLLGYRGISRDVTERKHAQEELAESRKKYRGLVEKVNDWVWEIDADGVYTYVSPRALELLGYTPEEIVGKMPFDFMPPAEAERVWNAFQPIWLARKPLERLENTLVRKDGRLVTVETSGMPVFADDGSFLGYTGIDRDVTERKWAEEQLRRNEQDLNRAQAVAQTGSWRLDVRRNELLWSHETYRMFGIPDGTPMTYETFLAAVHPADREYVDRQWTAALRGEPYDIEHRILVAGQLKWVREKAELEFDEEGALRGGFGTVQDITERKRAEEALRASQSMLQSVMKNVPQGIFWKDRQSTYLGCNDVFVQAVGLESAGDVVGKTDYDMPWSPEQTASFREYDRRIMENDAPEYHIIEQMRDAHGRLAWVETNKVPLHDSLGHVIGILGTYEDITARKRAEEALQASEEKYRGIVETATEAIIMVDANARIVFANDHWSEIVGYSREEAEQMTVFEVVFPEDMAVTKKRWESRKQGHKERYEFRLRRKDGGAVWVLISMAPRFGPTGEFLGELIMAVDITRRKQVEEALRESEEKFRLLAETSPAAILIYQEGRYVYANPAAESLTGYQRDELLPQAPGDIVHPDYRQRVKQMVPRRAQGEAPPMHYELKILTKEGHERWMDSATASITYGNKPAGLVVAFDITERKRAAEALRREKTFTDRLLNAPRDTVFLFEPATGKPIRWNQHFAEVSGYDDEEIAGMKAPDDFYDEQDLKKAREALAKIFAEGQGVVELSLVTKQGTHVPFEYAATVVETEDGKALLLSIGRDITERKRAEEALRESEARFRIMADGSPNPIWVTDAEGERIFANKQYLEYFGISEQEIESGEWKPFLHPEDAPTYVSSFTASLKEHRSFSAEARVRRADGQWRWIESHAEPRLSLEGAFLGFVGITQDITERKRAERKLRELNATLESRVAQRTAELQQRARQLQKLTLELTEAEERERKRLAEILHDDLQQVLAAARFQVSLLGSRTTNDAESQEIVGQAKDLLGEAIVKSRSLSHELSAPGLSQTDLGEAFEWLVEQMQTKHGFTVQVEMPDRIEVASEPLRVLLYKAAQELLFNAIKYAGVHEAILRLRRRRGRICLFVSDKGRGFDPQGLGKAGGFGLLSIRERVDLLGGRMKIRSAIGKGSVFLIAIPDAEGSR